MTLKKYLVNFTLLILISFLFIQKAHSIGPSEFIQLTVNKASAALNKSYSKDEKIKILQE